MIIKSFPRIHLGLFNTGDDRLPAFGGMGFAVASSPIVVSTQRSASFEFKACPHYPEGDDGGVRAAIEQAARLLGGLPDLTVRIESHPPRHSGFGTGTAAVLAILDSLVRWTRRSISTSQLQRLSGRGGTSGIGVSTYFKGGFVVDGGHLDGRAEYLPSSHGPPIDVPPLLLRVAMPASWQVALVLPDSGTRFAGTEEVAFFRKTLPLPEPEVHHAIAIAYQLVARATLTADLPTLRTGLDAFSQVGLKRREIENQSSVVADLITEIRLDTALASTMSSMGPLVVAIGEEADVSSFSRLHEIAAHVGASVFDIAGPRNSGAEVLNDRTPESL